MKVIACFAAFLLGSLSCLFASHIRGGYIRVVSGSGSLSYKFEVIRFTDTGSFTGFGGGEVDFGDGTTINLEESDANHETILLDNETSLTKFTINHTYQAPGAYTVMFNEFYRNAGITNMMNSVQTPFFVSTQVIVDPFFGTNSTPELGVFPAVFSRAGSRFFSAVGSKDEQGDSLVYSLAVPLRDFAEEVDSYRWPNDISFYAGENRGETPVLKLDKLSGQLTWDTPRLAGEFAVAYKVIEYRKVDGEVHKLSETTVDLQIINVESDMLPPNIDFEYQGASNGRIDFTVGYETMTADSLEWSFYCSGSLNMNGADISGHQLTDTIAGGANFNGFVALPQSAAKPVYFVLAARSLNSLNPFKTVKSFAVNPTGEEYVISAVGHPKEAVILRTYPNPVAGTMIIQFPELNPNKVQEIELINAAGQSILKTGIPINGNLATLNTEDLPGGIYLLRTYLGQQIYYSRFIKE
ncbi:MAG: T9SS type A sorting domain-containing protein [Imperialibacter sp.]|uniref:T9SS type A sorting domain-containing protein n=1 Tax=Imperialibacter sp. TaxID=2038411 RepID=UPI003A88A163